MSKSATPSNSVPSTPKSPTAAQSSSPYARSQVICIAGSGGTHKIIPEAPLDGPASDCQIWKVAALALDDKRNILYIAEQTKIFRTLDLKGNRMLTLLNSPPLLGLMEKGATGLCYDGAFDALYLGNAKDSGRRIDKDDVGDYAIRPLKQFRTVGSNGYIPHRFTTDANGNVYSIPKGEIKIVQFSVDRQEYRSLPIDSVFMMLAETQKLTFEDIKFDIVRNCLFALAGPAVWRIMLDGSVTLYAGNSQPGYADGTLLEARFGVDENTHLGPQYMTMDDLGRIYISDRANCCIRVVDERGMVHTIGKQYVFGGKERVTWRDGNGLTAIFTHWLGDLAVTPEGTELYIADNLANRIRGVQLPQIISDYKRPRRESVLANPSVNAGLPRIVRAPSAETMTASQIAVASADDRADCTMQ